MKEYQIQFKSQANKIVGPSDFYLSYFVFVLKLVMWRKVQAFQPQKMSQTINLAKLQGEKLLDRSHLTSKSTYPSPSLSQTP